MITLLTGMPGAGKTAAMVDLVRQLSRDRPLFVHFDESERSRGEQKLLHETLKLPHTPVNAANWHNEVPDGGILVIDEGQGCWRPRGPSSKVPPAIAALETHRHAGVDIFITTQAPRLIDSNVRALVGRHVHIRDTGWLGRWWYEWPEVNESLSWKTCPVKKRYKLPKAVFDLYVSASVHTKPVRLVPKTLFVVAALLVLLAVLIFLIVKAIARYNAQGEAKSPVPAQVAPSNQFSLPGGSPKRVGPPDERVDFSARLFDRPWTAVAYDDLRRVVRMPVITGALCVNDVCECYHGNERLLDVSSDSCLHWAKYRPFNPYVSDSSRDNVEGRTSSNVDQNPAVGVQNVTTASSGGVSSAKSF